MTQVSDLSACSHAGPTRLALCHLLAVTLCFLSAPPPPALPFWDSKNQLFFRNAQIVCNIWEAVLRPWRPMENYMETQEEEYKPCVVFFFAH